MDGTILVSGSADECVRIWHVKSRFCIRVLEHKGPITNLIVTMTPAQMFENKFRPNIIFKKLQRNASIIDKDFTISVPSSKFTQWMPPAVEQELSVFNHNILEPASYVTGLPVSDSEHLSATKLKQINAELHDFIVKKILSRTSQSASNVIDLLNVEEAVKHVEKNVGKGNQKNPSKIKPKKKKKSTHKK